MPNHVTNCLIIGGVSEDRLKEIRTAIAGVDKESGKVEPLDFNKIIPMPPELMITSGGYTDYGLVVQHPEMAGSPHVWVKTLAEAEERLAKASPEDKENALKEGEQAYQNIKKYGCKDWYNWSIANWGTKWGAYGFQQVANDKEIIFDTAWATPYPVIQKMSEMFPDATFSVTYADEDLGQNCGRYTMQNGVETELYQPDGGSDEAMSLAVEIKGLQDELYKDEKTGEWKWHSDDEESEQDTVGEALNTLMEDGVVKTQDDHTAEIENDAEAKANEG